MKRRQQLERKGALEWLEEATHLLRTSPLSVLALYYIGALPFVLGLLYFWADMSRSPFAKDHLVEAALALTLAYLWMKTWQSVFCLRLRAIVAGDASAPLTFRRYARIFAAQTAIQPPGLLITPLALITIAPFAWVFGFYQSASALAEPDAAEGRSLFHRSLAATRNGAGQNYVTLLVLGLFAAFVFVNWCMVCAMLPGLLKTLLGIETSFSRSTLALLNSTFFATMAALTYLSVDPIVKALHVLRCFRSEAQATGDDLKAELRHVTIAVRGTTLILLLATLFISSAPVRSAEAEANQPATAPVASPAAVPPHELNRSIEDVINQQKYTWRMPREKAAKEPDAPKDNALSRFFTKIGDKLSEWGKAVLDWLEGLSKSVPRHAHHPKARAASARDSPPVHSFCSTRCSHWPSLRCCISHIASGRTAGAARRSSPLRRFKSCPTSAMKM